MLVKWSDFVITRIKFNTDCTRIEKVEQYEDSAGEFINKKVVTTKSVIDEIKNGRKFLTATKGENGGLVRGSLVEIIILGGVECLRTIKNGIEKDNLENLPELQ